MKLGCFGAVKDLSAIAAAGFDTIELGLIELAAFSDTEFAEFQKIAADSGLGFEVFSCFMPITERLYDETFDMQRWFEHARLCAERTHLLGTKLWPLGIGPVRSIPIDYPNPDAAKQKFETFVCGICETIRPYGIDLLIEPVNRDYTNYLHLIPETVVVVKRVGLDNCKTLCDMRHMVKSGEPFSDISEYAEYIAHAHIDYPLGSDRKPPNPSDRYDYHPYLGTLKSAGYDGIISVEAFCYNDLAVDGRTCVDYLRTLWHEL